MYSLKPHRYELFNFMLLLAVLLLLASCTQKKNPLVGKWDLIDEKLVCTNPIMDSLEKARIGIHKSGELINREEVEREIGQKNYFTFTSGSKYSRKVGKILDSGEYEMRDSFLLTSTEVLGMSIVSGGYQVHFIDENNLQLTLEMKIKNSSHLHTYDYFLRRSLINQ
jgi:hypothetical protein